MAGAASATAALSSVSDSSTSSVTSTNPNMKKKKRFSSSRNSIPSLKRRKVKNGDDGASEKETKSAPAAIENRKKMSAENPPIGRRPGGNSSFPPPRSSQVEDSTPCWCQLISEYPQNDTIKISSKSFSVGWNKGCDLRLDDKAQNGILCIIKLSKLSPEGYFKAVLHINKKGYVQLNEKTLLENTFRNLCSGDELQFGMCGYHSYIFQQIRNREGSDDCQGSSDKHGHSP